MPVCKFYLNGNCKFGDNCRNQHPPGNAPARPNLAGGGRGQNRFDALANDYRQRGGNHPRQDPDPLPYKLDKERIRIDLTQDRPVWILSSYAPTQDVPRQLFGGLPREQSFEELRLRHYELAAAGQEQQAVHEATSIYDGAEKQIQEALGNLDEAIRYIVAGKDERLNRLEICKESPRTGSFNSSSSVSLQAHQLAKPQNINFGQPSQPAKSQAFGQPSLLGRPQNPFAKPLETQTFGRPSQPVSIQPWPSTQSSITRNPFAQSADQTRTGFGSLATSATVPDGPKPSQLTGFAQNATEAFAQGAFGSMGGRGDTNNGNPLGSRAILQPSTGPSSSAEFQGPSLLTNAASGRRDTRKDANGRLVSRKGKQVSYIDEKPCVRRPNGDWERIWFPEMPSAQKDEATLAGQFTEALKEDYRYLQEHGTFRGGLMPELPPKQEWNSWDF